MQHCSCSFTNCFSNFPYCLILKVQNDVVVFKTVVSGKPVDVFVHVLDRGCDDDDDAQVTAVS